MTAGRNRSELTIVGGGVVGLSIALEARRLGLSVQLLERGRCGRESSWAAAGMLSPLGEALEPGPFLQFGVQSLRAYPDFVEELEAATGLSLEHRRCGKLRVALSEDEEERLRGRFEWARQQGFTAQWLGPEAVRDAEPALSAPVRGGLLLEEDFRLDNRALGDALAEACRRAGVDVLEGTEVAGVEVDRGRCIGVRLADGSRAESDAVLVAAGAWSGQIGGIPDPPPVRPVRGQMLALKPASQPSRRVLESEEVYLVPRDDGRLLVGATAEDRGFRRGLSADGIHGVLDACLRLVPTLSPAPIVEFWSGFRPGTPDGLPILGEHPGVERLYLASGHFRNGILLAPATARAMGALIAGTDEPGPPPEFHPGRFHGDGAPAPSPRVKE
jgi:glycine oxidase